MSMWKVADSPSSTAQDVSATHTLAQDCSGFKWNVFLWPSLASVKSWGQFWCLCVVFLRSRTVPCSHPTCLGISHELIDPPPRIFPQPPPNLQEASHHSFSMMRISLFNPPTKKLKKNKKNQPKTHRKAHAEQYGKGTGSIFKTSYQNISPTRS